MLITDPELPGLLHREKRRQSVSGQAGHIEIPMQVHETRQMTMSLGISSREDSREKKRDFASDFKRAIDQTREKLMKFKHIRDNVKVMEESRDEHAREIMKRYEKRAAEVEEYQKKRFKYIKDRSKTQKKHADEVLENRARLIEDRETRNEELRRLLESRRSRSVKSSGPGIASKTYLTGLDDTNGGGNPFYLTDLQRLTEIEAAEQTRRYQEGLEIDRELAKYNERMSQAEENAKHLRRKLYHRFQEEDIKQVRASQKMMEHQKEKENIAKDMLVVAYDRIETSRKVREKGIKEQLKKKAEVGKQRAMSHQHNLENVHRVEEDRRQQRLAKIQSMQEEDMTRNFSGGQTPQAHAETARSTSARWESVIKVNLQKITQARERATEEIIEKHSKLRRNQMVEKAAKDRLHEMKLMQTYLFKQELLLDTA